MDGEAPSEFTAKDLIAEFAVEEGTYEIPLKTGRKIVVRRVVDYRTMVTMNKRAAKIFDAAKKGAIPPSWKPYLPITEETAEIVANLTALIVDPKFSDLEVLELCRTSGVAATFLHGKIKLNIRQSVPATEDEGIEEEKNDLGPIG